MYKTRIKNSFRSRLSGTSRHQSVYLSTKMISSLAIFVLIALASAQEGEVDHQHKHFASFKQQCQPGQFVKGIGHQRIFDNAHNGKERTTLRLTCEWLVDNPGVSGENQVRF